MAGLWINGCNVATWLLLHSFVADGLLLAGVVDRVVHVQKKDVEPVSVTRSTL